MLRSWIDQLSFGARVALVVLLILVTVILIVRF